MRTPDARRAFRTPTCYAIEMFRSATLDGMLLAASARGELAEAATRALSGPLEREVRQRREELAGHSPTARVQALRRMATRLRPALQADALPARARALLATEVDSAQGERWLEEAPPARRGYRASHGLRATLSRLARRRSAPPPSDSALRGLGRRLLAQAARALGEEHAVWGSVRVEAAEAAAYQALADVGGDGDLDLAPGLVTRLLAASAARPRGMDVSVALGHLLRGAQGEDALEHELTRAGRELAEWTTAVEGPWPG